MDDRPIGVFDSGFGGLTVARALIDLLPDEDVVYFGDTARYPYGPRPLEEVREFARQIASLLVNGHDVKMLVVACNTAAAAALEVLRFDWEVPIVGVIDPGVRSLVSATRNGRVWVIGTVGTIGSGAYQRAVSVTRAPVALTCAACPGFVEFVERGETRSEQVHVLAERLLAPVKEAGVDALLLGCTHYPFLARTISEVMGRDVVLVSSADETAFEVRSILGDTGLVRRSGRGGGKGRHRFISSGDVEWFKRLGSQLLEPKDASEPVASVAAGPPWPERSFEPKDASEPVASVAAGPPWPERSFEPKDASEPVASVAAGPPWPERSFEPKDASEPVASVAAGPPWPERSFELGDVEGWQWPSA